MMHEPIFASILSIRLSDFVASRRAGGSPYDSQATLLSYFDRFLCQENFNGQCPTRDLIQRYSVTMGHLHPNTRRNRISVLRQFCLYLRQFELNCYVPERTIPVKQVRSRIPHIFTEHEMKDVLRASRHLTPVGSFRPKTYYTLFGLLYSTGLRIGEAIRLNLADVKINRRLLYIDKSKFRKSRWVPMSPSTSQELERFIQERIRFAAAAPSAPVFVNLKGNRLYYQGAHLAFSQILSRCGLRGCKGTHGPRIHDLRHSYACSRLLAWYRQGKDVQALLPVLATYLGHKDITSTQVYLRATAELLEEANQRFLNNFRENVLKKGKQK